MSDRIVLVGGSNQIAAWLVPRMLESGFAVTVISQGAQPPWVSSHPNLQWEASSQMIASGARALVHIGPLEQFEKYWSRVTNPESVIVFSSTSRYAKAASPSASDRAVAAVLAAGEEQVRETVGTKAALTILRPTMIYGAGLDRNLTRLAGLLKKVRIMPLPGPAQGLRQPVHAEDLAKAVLDILHYGRHGEYQMSGGEELTYRIMVVRIFESLGLSPRFLRLGPAMTGPALWLLRRHRRWADLNRAMLERMELDLTFDHAAARRDFGYDPRPFHPTAQTWLPLHEREQPETHEPSR